jgi:hypothetical protein
MTSGANNLEKLKALDFETVVPGHGEPFKGKDRSRIFQAFLRDLWNQTKALHDQNSAVGRWRRSAIEPHGAPSRAHTATSPVPGFQEASDGARIYQVLDQRGSARSKSQNQSQNPNQKNSCLRSPRRGCGIRGVGVWDS